MNNPFYKPNDFPTSAEKNELWKNINHSLPNTSKANMQFHWKSFWIGNAAAILLIFASIGMYQTGMGLLTPTPSDQDQVYRGLNAATQQLDEVAPSLIKQAGSRSRPSMESTLSAIREIDRLIAEIKNEILVNGITPSKKKSLNRLYATKLDFYKELLLINREQS
ncbi:hypothetical protein [Gracilimonas sp.]|uniref:hypothetical protein n=1 Tax=Gracilimonas sp. TaxID=1974203 RepID=UPI0028717870|nr:hypothetical protein [Gracilimonas sp.]